jgi:hypothetical protein
MALASINSWVASRVSQALDGAPVDAKSGRPIPLDEPRPAGGRK